MELRDKSKNPLKGLINIKKMAMNVFFWCHIRHLNPLRIHPERITKMNKK